jgi:hypothetical protein
MPLVVQSRFLCDDPGFFVRATAELYSAIDIMRIFFPNAVTEAQYSRCRPVPFWRGDRLLQYSPIDALVPLFQLLFQPFRDRSVGDEAAKIADRCDLRFSRCRLGCSAS